MKLFRRAWQVLAAVALVAVLAVLYQASEPGEMKHQNQILVYLRQLREVDAAWNREIAGVHSEDELSGGPLYRLTPLFQSLADETAALHNPGLDNGLLLLRGAFLDKQRLVNDLEKQVGLLRAHLAAARIEIVQLRRAGAAARPGMPAGEGSLESHAAELEVALGRLYAHPDAETMGVAERALAALRSSAPLQSADAVGLIAPLAERVQAIIPGQRGLEPRLEEISRLPTLPRIQSLNEAYDHVFESVAAEKERFRIYLAFYSAALLVLVGYVLWELNRSNQRIQEANAALLAMNESLEHRVFERTSELSEALKHLKESESLLVQTEKLSSLGQMVAGIAHEINTPLAYVKSSLESLGGCWPEVRAALEDCSQLLAMLQGGQASDEDMAGQFARVATRLSGLDGEGHLADAPALTADGLHGVEQISEIISNLKNFSRLDRNKVAMFNLNEGIESTLVIARNLVKHRQVKKRLGNIPPVECSPSQINQVFLNLITNATQATEEGTGIITLASHEVPSGAEVRVDVIDNGHGIPEAVLSKIFDPFFTTKDVGEGTGLGLSIAYKIIREHGGRIEVKSRPGTGTMFSVFLPSKTPQRPQKAT